MRNLSRILLLLLVLVGACEAPPTPFPADVAVVPTATHDPNAPTSLRYAIDANANGLVGDLATIQASGQVEQLMDPIVPEELGTRYEIAAGYGELAGSARSPTTQQVSLIINSGAAIFADTTIAGIVPQVIDTPSLTTSLDLVGATAAPDTTASTPLASLRVALANEGWPDGIDVSMGYDAPGVEAVVQQLGAGGVHARPVLLKAEEVQAALTEKRVELALVVWITPEERAQWVTSAGENNVIDLYSVPISYVAVPGLKITFTPQGWPLASR